MKIEIKENFDNIRDRVLRRMSEEFEYIKAQAAKNTEDSRYYKPAICHEMWLWVNSASAEDDYGLIEYLDRLDAPLEYMYKRWAYRDDGLWVEFRRMVEDMKDTKDGLED